MNRYYLLMKGTANLMDNSGFTGFVKKNWFGLISIGISLTALAVYLMGAGGVKALFSGVSGINKRWLTVMIVCMLLFWFTDGLVLHVFVRMKYKSHTLAKSIKTTMIGLLYNNLTPFGSGGQPIQVYDMTRDSVGAGDAASYITVKTLLYQMCLTVYAIAVLAFTYGFFKDHIPQFAHLLWVAAGINTLLSAAVCAIALNKAASKKIADAAVKLLSKIRVLKNRDKIAGSLTKHIALFNESFILIFQKKNRLILGSVLTVLQQTFYYCLPYCIYRSFNMTGDSFALILGSQAILSLLMAFVPIPGGSGAAESGFYVFFTLFFPDGVIMPAMFIWRFLTYYSTIIVGGAVSFYDSHKKGQREN